MEDEGQDIEVEFTIEKPKTYEKGSKMDTLVTIIDNQTELLDWLATFNMPDTKGNDDLYDKWVEQKIKVASNAMRLVMRCQAEFVKLSQG